MISKHLLLPDESIISKIYEIRSRKIMLDRDLASLYGVPTKVLNQAVKRHLNRFPEDFMFQLTKIELDYWKSQFVTSNSIKLGLRKLPLAFTELGVAMLSSVLNSEQAVEVNIRIIRIFNRLREMISSQNEILLKIELLEEHVGNHDDDIKKIFAVLRQLIQQPSIPRNKIGFKVDTKSS